MERVLVIGGSGFLGRHLIRQLNTNYDVYNLDFDINYDIPFENNKLGSVIDPNVVREAITGIDYVYHFAAIADIAEAKSDPHRTVNINVLGTLNVLSSCVEHNVKRLVFASTIYVYSHLGSFYKVSKQCCELIIENYVQDHGLNASIIRFGSLYGTDTNDFNSIHKIIRSAIKEKKVVRDGTGEEEREYIHVQDAAMICQRLLENDFNGCEHVMATGYQRYKIREIINMINKMLGDDIEVEFTGKKNVEHYSITPYRFQPKVARKIHLERSIDLGQGLFECIEELYKQISNDH